MFMSGNSGLLSNRCAELAPSATGSDWCEGTERNWYYLFQKTEFSVIKFFSFRFHSTIALQTEQTR